jgi:pSer/pThr/pTyr-binding forkhead associated (FHA) protein
MGEMVTDLETAWAIAMAAETSSSPAIDETMHHATMQIDSIQSYLSGPRFTIAGSGAILPIPPNKDEVLIGRADPRSKTQPDLDLSMYGGATAGVSRQHARLLREDENWIIEDLRSTNGTYVNNEAVTPTQPAPLSDGDNVRFGHLVLTFRTSET